MRLKMIVPQISDNATTANMTTTAPILTGNLLEVQDGENARRRWGCVKVTSTVVVRTRTFTAIHVGVAHKHGGSQGWYYFEQPAGETPKRRTAAQLSSRRRRQVLDAYDAGHAPSWAKLPFSRQPRKSAKPVRRTRYKKVARVEGKLVSVYDGSEYTLGKTRRERVEANHGGGFYVYRTPELAAERTAFPDDSIHANAETLVLECEVWGRNEFYGEKEFDDVTMTYFYASDAKEAWTYCRPVSIVE